MRKNKELRLKEFGLEEKVKLLYHLGYSKEDVALILQGDALEIASLNDDLSALTITIYLALIILWIWIAYQENKNA